MNQLTVQLENCYGIQRLDSVFDFSSSRARAFGIYAPNGLMKTSFAKTFEALSKGELPREERYERSAKCIVKADGQALQKEEIYVLKSEIDIKSDSRGMTAVLVNPESKSRYDEIILDLDKIKVRLVNALQKASKLKKADVEKTLCEDFSESNFEEGLKKALTYQDVNGLYAFDYATIFDPKLLEVIKNPDFVSKANEFNERYQELFNQELMLYKKGVFNPTKADTVFSTLEKQGFFSVGHRVHIKGDNQSIDKTDLDKKIRDAHSRIDGDERLKGIRQSLAKNAQTQALTEIFEVLPLEQIDFLLENLKPERIGSFKKMLWALYIKSATETMEYISALDTIREERRMIELEAAKIAPRWNDAISLFNDRFVDMPFTLRIANQAQATLGREEAKLLFVFKDGDDVREWTRTEIKTLSQGEQRALYLLNFIFDVESRKLTNQRTLFIIDDIADSFDYKNKHAIIQYLSDLSSVDYFFKVILTHNFDFFRSIAGEGGFIPYKNALMANKEPDRVTLEKAEGVNNIFIKKWKALVKDDLTILCASVPFTRNILEYTDGDTSPEYLKLTNLVHWKEKTSEITVGEYLSIYDLIFGTSFSNSNPMPFFELLFSTAEEIKKQTIHPGLNLENKVLLSIAIRMKAEKFITEKLRLLKNDPDYWCPAKNQFGKMFGELKALEPIAPEYMILEKVSVTVSSNIHLNSFMYEPILDLSIDHLIKLYNEVSGLQI